MTALAMAKPVMAPVTRIEVEAKAMRSPVRIVEKVMSSPACVAKRWRPLKAPTSAAYTL